MRRMKQMTKRSARVVAVGAVALALVLGFQGTAAATSLFLPAGTSVPVLMIDGADAGVDIDVFISPGLGFD